MENRGSAESGGKRNEGTGAAVWPQFNPRLLLLAQPCFWCLIICTRTASAGLLVEVLGNGGRNNLSGLVHLGKDPPELDSKAHLKEAVSLIKDAELHSAQAHALDLFQVVHQPP